MTSFRCPVTVLWASAKTVHIPVRSRDGGSSSSSTGGVAVTRDVVAVRGFAGCTEDLPVGLEAVDVRVERRPGIF